ncbi:MAG: porin family protein [Pseudomonadota bacterium]
MNKLAMSVAVLAAALTAPAVSHAQDWYTGASYTHYDFDGTTLGGVTGRLGYKFTPNLALEGEGTIGVKNDTNAELDNAYGLYGVGTVPVTSNLDVFGRVGYQKVDVNGRGGAPGFTQDGVGYGAGATFHVTDSLGIRGEYTRLDGDRDADTFSLGGSVRF